MGRSMIERSNRNNKSKPQSKPKNPNNTKPSLNPTNPIPKFYPKSLDPFDFSNPNPSFDQLSEEQLEESLLKNLEFMYREAITKLVSLGYDENLAIESVLNNGQSVGSMDALVNILDGALDYIHKTKRNRNVDVPDSSFANLRQLVENSVNGMVGLLQQARPQMSRGTAIRCLIASLHLGRASAMEIANGGFTKGSVKIDVPVGVSKWQLTRDQAASVVQPKACSSSSLMDESHSKVGVGCDGSDSVSAMTSSLGNMSISEKMDGIVDERDEMASNLKCQVVELELQIKEWRNWAQNKVIQAAKKLSNDRKELILLRMESEEMFEEKKDKQTLEDTTLKKLSKMESDLRKESGEFDRANAAVRHLEAENAEIKAEMEAANLSASESADTLLEFAKREKRCLKKLLAWEKQKDKMQEDVAEEKEKIAKLRKQLQLVKEAQKDAEEKWREEVKAKELAIACLQEERRSKEAAEANVKMRQEYLHRKIEMDSHRYKDDIQRLARELSRLKALAESSQPNCPQTSVKQELHSSKKVSGMHMKRLHDIHRLQQPSRREVGHDRECLLCMKDEVSVLFLPCAHQVICAGCNADHEKESKTNCPCCDVRIKERIRVYVAS